MACLKNEVGTTDVFLVAKVLVKNAPMFQGWFLAEQIFLVHFYF